ncbi:hypothetical protein BVX98_04250 [bacterium F11]|nr:hypothetical protein BVX98_04250 [bacterium F11]
MNVFARTCVMLDSDGVKFLREVEGKEKGKEGNLLSSGPFQAWEVSFFSNSEGLLADPTRYRREPKQWPSPLSLNGGELIALLEKYFILIANEKEYRSRGKLKTSFLDSENLGNFHQQMGQELMLKQRVDPGKWWVHQKFTEDYKSVRNNLYGAVQDHSLKSYFKRRFSPESTVVDIGCGIGYYSNKMAEYAKLVLGIDPNKKYIEMAKGMSHPRAQFDVAEVGKPDAMKNIQDGFADFVFISDALLFYHVSPVPNPEADLSVLLRDIRRILKPNGTFISVEPHPVFWLLPWLGDTDRPFTIRTEYLNRRFHVTGTMSEIVQSFAKGGFSVTWMEDLTPNPAYEKTDPRGYSFAKEFPLWNLMELKPLNEVSL